MSQITSLGKYHILERVAADWMSEIYRVKTIGIAGFEKIQALKKILPEHSEDPVFFRTFIAQAKEAFSLNHRNIVQVFEFGKTGEDLFLAMEHIPGVNLAAVVARARSAARQIPVGLTCYLMGEVAAGLEYAHRKTDHHGRELGINHCQITPLNVACSFEGSVKILDFGLSRTAWLMAPRGDIFPGDPRYLSPEQIRGEELDSRSDLFSFGVLLWELLAGMPLFQENSREALFRRILHDAIPSPRTLNPDIPPGLEELAMTCLAREAHQRTHANLLQGELHKTQRQLGAVIGSRALSTFLDDLFPTRSDTLDARQTMTESGDLPPSAAKSRPSSSRRRRPEGQDEDSFEDLFLQRPGTLFPSEDEPPEELDEPPAPVETRLATPLYAGPPVIEPSPFAQPDTAGVLRTGRPMDEEISSMHAAPPESLDPSALHLLSSDELIADTGATGALTGSLEEDELSFVDLGDAELEDDPSLVDRDLAEVGLLPPDDLDQWGSPDMEPTGDLLDQWGSPDMDPSSDLIPAGSSADSQESADRAGQWEAWPENIRMENSGEVVPQTVHEGLPPASLHPASSAATAADELDPVPSLDATESSTLEIESRERTRPTLEATTPAREAHGAHGSGGLHELETGSPELSDAPTAPGGRRSAKDDGSLPQRKRFIAVSLVLDGAPTALEEAAQLITDIAFKMDGLVHNQDLTGGSLLVLFGLPTADELDIVSAVRFALDSQEAVDNLRTAAAASLDEARRSIQASSGLGIRIGIRAGTARSSNRAPWRHGYQLLGNIQRTAEDLPRGGKPGQILLAGLASRLALPHYTLRGAEVSKAKGGTLACHRLMGPRPADGQRQSQPGSLLVGREVEIQAVKSTWRECLLQGQQRSALVIGEAGIGKSRLVDHFLDFFAQDVQLLAARATPHRRGIPNSILVDLLQAATGMGRVRNPTLHSRLATSLSQLLGDSGDDHTAEALLSLVSPPATRQQAPGGSQEGAVSPLRLQRAMRKLLNRVAWDRPVVVIVEDLHWADSTSLECLAALIERPAEAAGPILFLLTSRPEEGAVMQALVRAEGVTPVLLDELDEQDRRRLISGALGPERASEDLVREVAYRAGGNPFYIRELTRAVAELDADGLAEVPATVQRVIAGRVDRLPAQVKIVLQHAAVIGPTFREPILARLLGRNPARALGTLRNRGIIVPGMLTLVRNKSRTGEGEQFEREWTFRNMLLREVINGDIGLTTRRRIHLKVGEIMSRRAADGSSDPPADVARHLELGGQGRKAGGFYLRAADEASATYPSPEALQLYDNALRLSEGNPDQRYAVLAGRERVFRQLGWSRHQAEDLESLRPLVGDDPSRVADLRNREASYLLRRGDAGGALSAAEQAEEAATRCGVHLSQAEALRLKGEAYDRLNNHKLAVDAVEGALALFQSQGSVHDQVRTLITLGRISLGRARYEEAYGHFDDALELLKSAEDRWQERILRYHAAVIHYCRGHYPQALGEALYSLKLCEQYGDRAREGDSASVVGIVYLELGLYEPARQYLEAALAIHRETGSRWIEADTGIYLGLLEAACQQHDLALEHLASTRELAESISARSITIAARNAVAWVLCERGGKEDVEDAAEEGLAAAEEARSLGLIVGEIPGLSRAARGYAAQGLMEEARSLSRRAVELLRDQGFIETPEEEIFFGHYKILNAMGDPTADRWLARARQRLETKLGQLDNQEWQEAYTTRVALTRAILAAE